MNYRIIYILLILVTVSCTKKKLSPEQKKILFGDWERISYDDNEMAPFNMEVGFNFLPDGTYEDKLGFFDFDEVPVKYEGNMGQYQIINDTIKMSVANEFYSRPVYKLTKDTLILGTKDDNVVFLKKQYDTLNIPEFDEIAISLYANSDILLNNNQEVYFSKWNNYNKKVHYKTSIDRKFFSRIITQFKKADYINLQNNYNADSSEDNFCAVTFFKNKKILHSVTFYISSVPPEFKSAYTQLLYMPQILSVIPDSIPEYLELSVLKANRNNKHLELSKSEGYYLLNMLRSGNLGTHNFNEEYNLIFKSDYVNKITTDGRYYKFYVKNGDINTIDIGTNFLQDNNFSNRFKTE